MELHAAREQRRGITDLTLAVLVAKDAKVRACRGCGPVGSPGGSSYAARMAPDPTRARRARRLRDRRGRGLRGRLAPPDVPLYKTRADQFDDLVREAVAHLDNRWAAELAEVEFVVDEVPPPEPGDGAEGESVDPLESAKARGRAGAALAAAAGQRLRA